VVVWSSEEEEKEEEEEDLRRRCIYFGRKIFTTLGCAHKVSTSNKANKFS